jgi:hypothetical protein
VTSRAGSGVSFDPGLSGFIDRYDCRHPDHSAFHQADIRKRLNPHQDFGNLGAKERGDGKNPGGDAGPGAVACPGALPAWRRSARDGHRVLPDCPQRTSLGAPGNHEILTASYMGWGKLKNGELLRVAKENGIEILVTGDRSLVYEQNLTGRRLAIVALSTNNRPIVRDYVAQILAAIDGAAPGSFQEVECGHLGRKDITGGH